ncbi:MAG: DUF11 domain-containing protein, partial [Anaerolineales bacterium]|nr:DUF11 domain-containing protein [Anaerolineales bacterium]
GHQYEIYGRRVSNTGTFPANEFQISQVGSEVGSNFDAAHAKVAYNPTEQLFLVVWRADDTTDEDHEIYSAWLDDTSGTVTVDLAAVSSMGPDANGNYQADRPAVAYGTASQKALVVWEGDDDTGSLVDNKMEIYGGFVSLAECNAFDTADLSVSISESADPVLAGSGAQNLTYVVTLTNNGPDTACNTNVAIDLTLPGNGVSLNSTSPSGGTTYISPNWIIGDLPASSSETLTFKLTVAETAVPATNAITLSAGATSETPLLMTGDDNDSEQTSIISNSFSVSDASIVEGNSGAQSLSFTVNRTNNSIASSVDFATTDVTAVSDTDYIGQSTTVNFGAGGALSQQVTVPINGDTLVELDETFTVNLSNPVNGFIASEGDQATGTITNDDSATISINNVTQSEGNVGQTIFSFALTLSAGVDQAVAVGYSTADGTATTADSDYVSKSGSVNFTGTAGETKNIQITVNGDTKVEGNETFVVNLNAPTSGGRTVSLTSSSATGTINNDDATTVDFTKSSYTVSESAANGTLTVQLSNPSAFTVQVDYASSNGTATAGADYTAVNDTLTFPPGVTSQTINIPILTDGSDETDETVIVTLSNASNATLGTTRNPATLVIVDDDGPPTVNLSSFDFTVGEADGVVTATVSLSSPAGQTIEVDYTTINGSAIGGSDYTAATNTLSFPLNAISQTITISITNDSFNEATESFTLALQNPVNVSLGLVQTSTITIEDDDNPPTVDFEATDFTVLEDGGTAAVDVVLDSPSGQDITVYYTTADDSALAGSDYTAATDAILIPSGTVTGTISIAILDDMTYEPTEAFTLTLTGANNASVSDIPDKTITILDDDPLILPDVGIGDVTADEGDTNTLFTFPITLSLSSSYPTTITYVTADGTALAGADYVASTNTIVVPAGMISGTVSIVVIGDLTAEPAETFEVILTNVENGTITDGTGVGTILNDDPIVLPEVTIGDVTAVEGDVNNPFSFPITLSLASALPTTITYSTADNTASAGEDYIAVADTIVIPAGVTTAAIDVTVVGDVGQELDETFILKIDALENGIIAKGAGTGTILNDDTLILPNASIGDITAVEGDTNNDFVFVVTLDMTSTLPFSVTYNTSNGTATAGSDYTAASGTVMIPAGADTATITVNVIGDTRYEADETFMVVLTGAVNGYIADSVGMATLLNDDERQLLLPIIIR